MNTHLYIISACLCGIACRYNGTATTVPELAALHAEGKALALCPEVLGGLETPRPPCELQEGSVVTSDGADVTAAFLEGAQHMLFLAQQHGITHAILKENSPSCGSSAIYDGTFSGTRIPGQGVTAKLLAQHNIQIANEHSFQAMLAAPLHTPSSR